MLRLFIGFVLSLSLWLVAGTAGAADPPLTCPQSVTGQIDPVPVDQRQSGRIAQGFQPTACGAPVGARSVIGGRYGHDAHVFKNRSAQTCIKATLKLTSSAGSLSAAAYASSFDPANVTARLAGVTGNVVRPGDATQSFSFDVPSLSDFVVVVNETLDGGGGSYSLNVSECGQVLVSRVDPNFGPSKGGTAVVVHGAGFRSGAKVSFGGVAARDVVVQDEFKLRATTPAYAGGGASPHAVDVVVSNADATRAIKTGGLTYYDPSRPVVTLTSQPGSSQFGQAVVFKAHVEPKTPRPATGSVDLFEGARLLQTVSLDGSADASITISDLPVGAHNVFARYRGDDFFATGDSAVVRHIVSKADTYAVLVSSKNPSAPTEDVTLTVLVAVQLPGAGVPTGFVSFREGPLRELGRVALDAQGQANLTMSFAPGEHELSALYEGAESFESFSTESLRQKVMLSRTEVALSAFPQSPAILGKPISLTARVTVRDGQTVTGTVTFTDRATTPPTHLGTGTLRRGEVTLVGMSLRAGTHAITASYEDPNHLFDDGSASLSYTIDKATTSMVLTSSKLRAQVAETVRLTAKVARSFTGAPLSGSVEFKQNGTLIGTATLGPDFTASVNFSSYAMAGYKITAEYKGNESFAKSTASLTQYVDYGPGKDWPDHEYDYDDDKHGCDCSSSTSGAPGGFASLAMGLGFALMLVRRRARVLASRHVGADRTSSR